MRKVLCAYGRGLHSENEYRFANPADNRLVTACIVAFFALIGTVWGPREADGVISLVVQPNNYEVQILRLLH